MASDGAAAHADASETKPQKQNKRRDNSEHDITSLDGPSFSVDAWLEAKKSLGLETLLQQQRTLRADITRFKNNTQNLVHDNYSRFITAADIIKTMRSEFETMVLDTDNLKSTMDSATDASEAMNSSLQARPHFQAPVSQRQGYGACTASANHSACLLYTSPSPRD